MRNPGSGEVGFGSLSLYFSKKAFNSSSLGALTWSRNCSTSTGINSTEACLRSWQKYSQRWAGVTPCKLNLNKLSNLKGPQFLADKIEKLMSLSPCCLMIAAISLAARLCRP